MKRIKPKLNREYLKLNKMLLKLDSVVKTKNNSIKFDQSV